MRLIKIDHHCHTWSILRTPDEGSDVIFNNNNIKLYDINYSAFTPIKLVTGVPPVFLQDSDVIPLMRRHLSVQTGAYISLKALPVGQMCLFHLSLFSQCVIVTSSF